MNEITPQGLQKLKDELDYLETTKRREIAARLERAISYGDISENADYEEAKEEQSKLEERVREIKQRINSAAVVSGRGRDGTVQLGSVVTVETGGTSFTYTLVSPEEADPAAGRISADSPLGRALRGRRKGERVKANLPAGTKTFTITKL